MKEEFIELLRSTKREGIENLLNFLEKSDFYTAPASTRFHGNYEGGLSEHRNKFPSQLSGGQQQRCAIARALIKNPKLLLCDEPTGALDSKTSRDILILLEKINAKYGTTMLIVTHNNAIKNMVHKVIIVKDGLIKKDYLNETRIPAAELEDL